MFYADPKTARAYFEGDFGGNFFPIDPDIHRIRRVHFTDFLNRDLKADGQIFVYWHTQTQNWVVAAYSIQHGWTGMDELRVLNHDPDGTSPQITDEDVASLRSKWFRPVAAREHARSLQEWRSADRRGLDDKHKEWDSKWQYVYRKLNHVRRERCQNAYLANGHKRRYC